MDKKIVLIGGLAGGIILLFLVLTPSTTEIKAPVINEPTKIVKKSNHINDYSELKVSVSTKDKKVESKKIQKENISQIAKNDNITENDSNQNDNIIVGQNNIDNYIYNNDLQTIKDNNKEVIFAKNNPEKSEFAPPMMPMIINYKVDGVKKTLMIPNNIAVNNDKIYIGEKKDGEITRLVEVPLKSDSTSIGISNQKQSSANMLTPPSIEQ